MQQKMLVAETLNEFVQKLLQERESWWQPVGKPEYIQEGVYTEFRQRVVRYSREPYYSALIRIKGLIDDTSGEEALVQIEKVVEEALDG